MDNIKIGKFISEKRKKKKLTQEDLAEILELSPKAISKWERGISLPDSSNIRKLCQELDISINDFFNGETVDKKNENKLLEERLLEQKKESEEKDKLLLTLEFIIGIISVLFFFNNIYLVAFLEFELWLEVLLAVLALIVFIVGVGIALKIEQKAGYYKCGKCSNKYVPTYLSVLWAMHINRTRYMKCPKCNKWSWQKKVIKKD